MDVHCGQRMGSNTLPTWLAQFRKGRPLQSYISVDIMLISNMIHTNVRAATAPAHAEIYWMIGFLVVKDLMLLHVEPNTARPWSN
jgi:hypothetical protein